MDHKYIESMLKAGTCGLCKRPAIDHSNAATCECCPNTGEMNIFMTMLMCDDCIAKEKELQKESRLNAETRVRDSNISMQARLDEVKHTIVQRSDIFNAKIPSLIDIQRAIDDDESIENKTFEKARVILELFNHLKSVITDARKVLDQANNIQNASQAELNILASQLKQEERDKLKLQDINYKPSAPKLKLNTSKTPKFDKSELKKYAAELNVPERSLQAMVVNRRCSVKEAAEILKGMLS